MGEVFLAEDTRLNRKVALKILPEKLSSNAEGLSRFQQEAYAASALNHPNIITVFDIDEFDGRHCIAAEFIDGQTLRERMKKGRNRAPRHQAGKDHGAPGRLRKSSGFRPGETL
jgi:serine/threonine protein kinase